jgi:hypothetical protein
MVRGIPENRGASEGGERVCAHTTCTDNVAKEPHERKRLSAILKFDVCI